jgi:hypothetical protein
MPRNFLPALLMMVGVGVAAFAALWAYSVFWSKTSPRQRLAALQKEVKPKGGEVFQTVLMGKPVAFLLLDCAVFLLDTTGEDVKRNKVLTPGFYFWLDVCTGQSISAEGEYVNVFLANRAIGAGGGNTTGGSYRSKDGITWEKKTEKGWQQVD